MNIWAQRISPTQTADVVEESAVLSWSFLQNGVLWCLYGPFANFSKILLNLDTSFFWIMLQSFQHCRYNFLFATLHELFFEAGFSKNPLYFQSDKAALQSSKEALMLSTEVVIQILLQYPKSCGRFQVASVRDLTVGVDSSQPDNKPVRLFLELSTPRLSILLIFCRFYPSVREVKWSHLRSKKESLPR